jgi:hypothetical protein
VARLQRSLLCDLVARVLVLTLLSWSLPFDFALPRAARPALDGDVVRAGVVEAAGDTLYVNANAGAACSGKSPCFTRIQAAIDAAGPGERVEIQAGAYFEQLRIRGKNARASASEADRIVIEADPESPAGSVVLRGRDERCEAGFAVLFERSKLVTVRGLAIAGAGARGILLRGGSRQNESIHLERNRIRRIEVGSGNPGTVIANNLIHGNGRNGILFRDGRGGRSYVTGNTIVHNTWSGVQITRGAIVELTNNASAGREGARGLAGRVRVGRGGAARLRCGAHGAHRLKRSLPSSRRRRVTPPRARRRREARRSMPVAAPRSWRGSPGPGDRRARGTQRRPRSTPPASRVPRAACLRSRERWGRAARQR